METSAAFQGYHKSNCQKSRHLFVTQPQKSLMSKWLQTYDTNQLLLQITLASKF